MMNQDTASLLYFSLCTVGATTKAPVSVLNKFLKM
uniref:Uncharacterized protein n=1 Tax=Arundo donax TaxID=35708 RepID=A0A0A9H1W7_ARUDO